MNDNINQEKVFTISKAECESFIQKLMDSKNKFVKVIEDAFNQYVLDSESKSGEELFLEFIEEYLNANAFLTDSVKDALDRLES